LEAGIASRCVSERGKKGFGSVPLREVIEKALPIALPHGLGMPSQRTTERTPERGIEEAVIHLNGAEGVESEDTNANIMFWVRDVASVAAFSGFGSCLFDGHGYTSLALRGHGGAAAHIARVSQEDSVGP
jgi:hypothetical protein